MHEVGLPSGPGVVQHSLEVALLMTGELTRPDTDFHRVGWAQLIDHYASHVKEARGKSALLDLLAATSEQAEAGFLAAGELAMLQLIGSTVKAVRGWPGCITASHRRCITEANSCFTSD